MLSKHISTILLALSILIVFGVLIVVASSDNLSEQNDQQTSANTEVESTIQTGIISGSVTHPSNRIPDSLQVCAENTDSGEITCTKEKVAGESYLYDKGYELEVPEGDYLVYAEQESFKAFHNRYTANITDPDNWPDYSADDCSQNEPLTVTVTADTDLGDIIVGDWYYDQTCQSN